MINLIGQWVGNSYGAHPCNAFVEFSGQNGGVTASIRVAVTGSPKVQVFVGNCIQTDGVINIALNESQNGAFTNITGNLTLNVSSEHRLEGNFELSNGAKGVINISRFLPSSAANETKEPPQIIAKEYLLADPLKIYKKDVEKVIRMMKELAGPTGKVVVTECAKSVRIAKYADNYLASTDTQEDIDSLFINSQTSMTGFVNTMTVVLNRHESSKIISQSADLVWSHAAPIMIQ